VQGGKAGGKLGVGRSSWRGWTVCGPPDNATKGVREYECVPAEEPSGRFQPLARPTPVKKRPEQARWADEMKDAMDQRRMSVPDLTARVAPELGLKPETDKVRRWLANETGLEPMAIPVLARAVGVHPLRMLAAHGLVEPSLAKIALRLTACERRIRAQRAQLVERYRAAGGALFAELALRHGGWAVTVVPHWRGRRCRYHLADYVLLDRLDGIPDRAEAYRVFGEAFDKTGAEWDDAPFAGEPTGVWKEGRIYVPRLATARGPAHYATVLDGVRGIVVAGPRWAGMYTVSALVAAALGWGWESFDYWARSLNPGAGPSVPLRDELMRGWLADPSADPHLVWAHILAGPGEDASASAATSTARTGAASSGKARHPPDVRRTDEDVHLLADASPDVQVVLLVPEDGQVGGGMKAAAELAGVSAETLRASVGAWKAALPERPGLAHVVVPTPVDRNGRPVGHSQEGFLDGFFDSAAEVALGILTLLAGGAPAGSLVPPPAAESDPFAALAAGT
jgi:hypothetical protein